MLKGGLLPFPRTGCVLYAKAILSCCSGIRQVCSRSLLKETNESAESPLAGTLAAPSASKLGMLEARLLTKRYAGIPVVDHVSFSIEPGEILGYVGPNGAGKS